MNNKAVYAIGLVYVGCGLNNVFLEYLIKEDPGCGHLITFLQFLFIAMHGFVVTSKFGSAQRKVKYSDYFTLVCLFFVTSVVNNWAFNFNIPVPLHMIFRSGSLIANMIMGIWLLKKQYTFSKYLSVFMITLGIVICTLLSSGKEVPKTCSDCGDVKPASDIPASDESYFFWWLIGVSLLTGALLLSARMGIYQEYLVATYGKVSDESLYYTHLLSLPGFLLYSGSIIEHASIATNSEPYHIPFLATTIPLLWLYLIFNVLTQYMCIRGVYTLTAECSSLTLTLVITLRKFFSLLLSIIYFKNPFTLAHWFGTALVFSGTLIFTQVPQRIMESYSSSKSLKNKKD